MVLFVVVFVVAIVVSFAVSFRVVLVVVAMDVFRTGAVFVFTAAVCVGIVSSAINEKIDPFLTTQLSVFKSNPSKHDKHPPVTLSQVLQSGCTVVHTFCLLK